MKLPRRFALVFASVSFGLVGCGSSQTPNTVTDSGVDSGAVDVVDVPVTPADVPMADAGSPLVLTATLSGRQVVPPAYGTSASGTVTFTLSPDRALLSYTITHTILLPSSTRLHIGLAGEAGAMSLSLTNSGGTTIGTSGVTAEQVRAITEGRAYVNIASSAFPEGELRGQIVQPGETVYTARLSADQENPPTTATSSGVAEFLVDPTANRLRFRVHVTGMTMAMTASHIHTAAAGINGPVLIDLIDPGPVPSGDFSGTRPLTAASLADLDAGRWYVNVHSAGSPAGEIRGQILRPGERLYIARMNGMEELPPVTTMATGTLGVIMNADRNSLSYDGVVTGVTPTAAHLHRGAMGVGGDVVTPLTIMGSNLRGTAAVAAASPLLTALPMGEIYANVHSTMFPGGEIRGQLRPAPSTP
jgi:hypothetical protein